MDLTEVMQYRALCLELAVKASIDSRDAYAIVDRAEGYWEWLTKENPIASVPPAAKTDDDITS